MTLGKSAVVLGGSIAGLSAAGALADYFDQVIVLERDILPSDAEHRRGVPQSKHPHWLLNSGRRAIDTLFPGFVEDILASGGLLLNPTFDAAYLERTGWAARKKSTMTTIYSSRILIERVMRDKVRGLPNVTIREGVTVQGLEYRDAGSPGGGVTGVRFQEGQAQQELIRTDLVIDAMGRGSPVLNWLEAAGWPAVPVKTLDAKVTYISRWYDLPPEQQRPDSWWWRHIVIMPAQDSDTSRPPEHAFLSNFFPIENNRALACMGSWGLEMPRTDDDFMASAERLRTPVFAAAMKQCEPTSEVHLTRATGNKWRRYDQLPTPPLGLVFVGDSICGFNPFYAQGISAASSSALLLKSALGRASATGGALDEAFVRRLLREQVKELQVPWNLAMARDRGYECATGTEALPNWQRRIVAAITWPAFNAITGAAREDEVVDDHFARVFNLDESLADMLKNPRVLFGLLRYQVRRLLGRSTVPYGFDPLSDPPGTDYTPAPAAIPQNA
ncbi:MAG: hypothetical protein K0U80_07410 [Actinomycetia bacterium]|nr:hypothetical protein [Actinomycetes bacterium]MCH9759444.1 hypothetical protein [Actinomycetes bacterium]